MQCQKSYDHPDRPVLDYGHIENFYSNTFEKTYKDFFIKKLDALKRNGQYREFVTLNRICGQYPSAYLNKKKSDIVTVWCSNDYLGMSQHPVVINAMQEALNQFGAGSGGSRNIGGTHLYYSQLESSLAELHNKEAALVFPTGYGSNDASLQCLLRILPNCVVFSDELNHASIINGIRSVNSEKRIFRHNDIKHLESLLMKEPLDQAKLIVFESVYSMDGDIAPINDIAMLAKKYNALTFLDEVHATGMYGARGAGMAAELGAENKIDIIQGTMAKAFGVIGGYIASSMEIIDVIRSFASGFIFTTSLPPIIVSGCYASIEYLKHSDKERQLLHEKTKILRTLLNKHSIPVMNSSQTHILPVLIGDTLKCKDAAKRLLNKHAIYLQPINSPTVPIGTERFRVNVTPNHTVNHIDHLVSSLTETFRYFDIRLTG